MNGNEPAYPPNSGFTGLTKRELISAMLMQELSAKIENSDLLRYGPDHCLQQMAKMAITGADILINKLNQ